MAATESGELEKYRKYIQRRRVTYPDDDGMREKPAENSIATLSNAGTETGQDSDNTPWWEKEAYTLLDQEELIKPPQELEKPVHSYRARETLSGAQPASRTRDHDLYKKLYSRYSRQGYRTSSYASPYRSSYSGYQAQIEDNRATLLAIKLIKQSLACFAILGIIVLMQGRPDMQEALAVVRRHVVETHIDPQTLFEDVKAAFNQFVQTLGGSP